MDKSMFIWKKVIAIILVYIKITLSQQLTTIAVLDFEGLGITEVETKALTNRLRINLVKSGAYQVIERGKMQDILNEQGFQLSGCTSEECVIEAGQLLGVEKMLAGSISLVGKTYSVGMRLIDVGSGKIEKSEAYDMRGEIDQLLTNGMKNALNVFMEPIKTQNKNYTSLFTETVTDVDGNVYKSVKIGNQWWMAENLKVTHYRNGDAIPNVTDATEWENLTTGAYCNYNNDDSYVDTYGSLYNWYAVNDSRQIAPANWHVPTDDEWKQLEMYLGMSQSEVDHADRTGTEVGSKMKETGAEHWNNPNSGATNESGFYALPGSFRSTYDGTYLGLGEVARFWSSTKHINYVWIRILYNGGSVVDRGLSDKGMGYSVRCIKD